MLRLSVLALMFGLVGIVLAGAASALTGLTNTAGTLTTLNSTGVAVSVNSAIAGTKGGSVSCSLGNSSPDLTAFKVGDLVAIDCQQGTLTAINSVSAGLASGTPLAGFSQAPLTPTAGSRVTTVQCAAAWNATATAGERNAVIALQPLAARVDHGTSTVAGVRGSRESQGPMCKITFILAGAQTIETGGVWKHGTVPVWHGSVWSRFLSTNEAGFGVNPDGSIQHR